MGLSIAGGLFWILSVLAAIRACDSKTREVWRLYIISMVLLIVAGTLCLFAAGGEF